jgi:hypothetical protein
VKANQSRHPKTVREFELEGANFGRLGGFAADFSPACGTPDGSGIRRADEKSLAGDVELVARNCVRRQGSCFREYCGGDAAAQLVAIVPGRTSPMPSHCPMTLKSSIRGRYRNPK